MGAALHLRGDFPTLAGWEELSCGFFLQFPGLGASPRKRLIWEVTVLWEQEGRTVLDFV